MTNAKPPVKYKISPWFVRSEIQAVPILRETAQFVFVAGNTRKGECREAKRSEYHEYCDTWEEAHAVLTAKADAALARARRNLQQAQDRVVNVKRMKAPETP